MKQYLDLLASLGQSVGNMQDAVLWWFDDGSLRALIDAIDTNEHGRDKYREQIDQQQRCGNGPHVVATARNE